MTPILLILTLVSTMFPDCVARQTSDSNGQPATVGELLQKHNIELSRPSLLRALKNSNPDVRYLAAMKLAADKDVDAIPAIERTLFTESLPRNRVNIGLALGLLGDQLGRDELKKACADVDFPSEYRMSAVRYMFDLGNGKDEGCLRAAEEVVRLVDSENLLVGDRISALELLPQFHPLTSQESQTIFGLVLDRLNDPEASVRMAASHSLAALGNQDAVPYLQAAIAQEPDENIRSVLETNLKTLQQKRN